MKQILILGGYGRAGKEIVNLLTSYDKYEIITAGRSESKAVNHQKELKRKFPNGFFRSAVIDLTERNRLIELIRNVDLVIAAVPLNYKTTLHLVDAVLSSNQAHYIDLSPSQEKHQAFLEKQGEIEDQEHIFILEAGFDPGLPGMMTRLGLDSLDQPKSVEVQAIYRDPDIPDAGIKDILEHPQKSRLYKNGMWRKGPYWKMKMIDFPMGFGKALGKPIASYEMKSITQEYKVNELRYYHAGINVISNIVMVVWQGFLHHLFPLRKGIAWFKWAIKKFTKKPYGGCIQMVVNSKDEVLRLSVGHHELYVATAIPVVATAHLLLQDSSGKSGYYFMGEWVQKDDFIENIKALGLTLSNHNS